nr:MAG TPA: FANCM pseudonuclease domain [Herelleviridae sp.]
MLSDSLGLDFHPKKECMVILHDEIADSPDDVKDSYNRLMSKLEEYGY